MKIDVSNLIQPSSNNWFNSILPSFQYLGNATKTQQSLITTTQTTLVFANLVFCVCYRTLLSKPAECSAAYFLDSFYRIDQVVDVGQRDAMVKRAK